MKSRLQINLLVLRIASTLIAADHGSWCYAIARKLGINQVTIFLGLRRMEKAGWIKSEWERINTAMVGRPRRRIYKITALGEKETRGALAVLPTLQQ